MDALVRVLDAAIVDSEAVTDHLSALSPSEVEELVLALPLVQEHDAAIDVVHTLLQQRTSRHASARAIVDMILARKLPSRWATELCMGYMPFPDSVVAADATNDVADTIDTILHLLDAYLRNPPSLSGDDDWHACQTVLDLLPALLTVSAVATSFFTTVLDAVLALPWSVPSLSTLLAFSRSNAVHLTRHHHAQLHALVCKFLPRFSSETKYSFWHALLLACFDLAERNESAVSWMDLARTALTTVPSTLHREMDYFIQTVFQHTPVYIRRWFESATAVAGPRSWTEWDLTLCVHGLHASQPLVVHPVARGGESASMYHQVGQFLMDALAHLDVASIPPTLQRLLEHGSQWKGRDLLDLAKYMLGPTIASPPSTAPAVWRAVFDTLFQEVAELRADLVGLLVAGFDSPHDLTQNVAESALSAIVTGRHHLLRPHLHEVQDRVCQLCQLNVQRGTRLLRTCDPLVATTPSFYHFLVVFLRKTLVSPNPEVAIAHVCHLLQAPSTTSDQMEDLVSCLNDALYLSSCRHVALAHVETLADVAPFERAILHALATLVQVDKTSLLLHMDQLDVHSGTVLRQCLALLPRLSSSTQMFGQSLTTHLKSVVSRAHCRTFLDAADDRTLAATYYASLATAAEVPTLRCLLLTSVASTHKATFDDPPTPQLINGLVVHTGGCCVHWSVYCLHHVGQRLSTLSAADVALFARQTVALYLTWHSSDVIAEHDAHPMPELKLPARKPIKPHEILTSILKVWPSLVSVVTPDLWGVSSWKPVAHALVAQLDQLLGAQRHIGLSVAIAEYLHVVWTRLDPTLGRSGGKRAYRLLCAHVVTSPKLLTSLLELVWVDASEQVARVVAVLREAQATTDHDDDDVAAPALTTEAVRKAAYADALKQVERILASGTSDVDDLATVGRAAWRRACVSYSHASHAMDAWLRAGKTALAQWTSPRNEALCRGPWDVVRVFAHACMDVGVAWKQEPELADVTVRMQRFLLDVSSKGTIGLKKRLWRANDAIATKQLVRAIASHVIELADRSHPHKWNVHHPKRRRGTTVRSRHAYIDDCLQEEESGDDAYADLEDFIVE